jgi:hypothetical protein
MNAEQIISIWDGIRLSEELTDYIIDCTREFLLRSFNNKYTYQNLCTDITNVYSALGSTGSLIDQELLGSIPLPKNISDILLANPWFVFLYMCEELISLGDADGKA